MNKHIGILGCGWLGFPLGKALDKKGYHVRGATRSKEQWERIKNSAISPFLLEVKEDKIEGELDFFIGLDLLIIALPPGLRSNPKRNFAQSIATVIQTLRKNQIQNVVFISSTSVYGDQNGKISERSLALPKTSSGKQLLACEKQLHAHKEFKTLIFRFGGLIGNGRHPIYTLSGRNELPNPEGYINFIHLEDCMGMLLKALEKPISNCIYNGVSPYHPTRREYYSKMAHLAQLPPPTFSELTTGTKIISSEKFQNEFSYSFLVENLLTLK